MLHNQPLILSQWHHLSSQHLWWQHPGQGHSHQDHWSIVFDTLPHERVESSDLILKISCLTDILQPVEAKLVNAENCNIFCTKLFITLSSTAGAVWHFTLVNNRQNLLRVEKLFHETPSTTSKLGLMDLIAWRRCLVLKEFLKWLDHPLSQWGPFKFFNQKFNIFIKLKIQCSHPNFLVTNEQIPQYVSKKFEGKCPPERSQNQL